LFAVEGIGAAIQGPVHRPLALLARALGEHALAEHHVARAVEAARGIGATGIVDQIQAEWSRPERAMSGDDQTVNENVFRRDGEYWTARCGRREVRLRDSKGMRDLASLLARPRVHVGLRAVAAG
jgi:hypothetical protein